MRDLKPILRARELTGGVTTERDRDIVWNPHTGEIYYVEVVSYRQLAP